MGHELHSAARLASDWDRALTGLDAGEPRTEHGALQNRRKLVESRTIRVLGPLCALSQTGRITLLTQAVDYQGTVGQVLASPSSLLVEVRARPQAVEFARMPDSGPWARRLGFAWHPTRG